MTDAGPPITALLVDDDDKVRTVVSLYLKLKGVMVHPVNSGEAARQHWLAGFRPDVIVTDYKMPDTNGVQLIQWFRAQGCTARMVMISGNVSEIVMPEGEDVQLIAKPFHGQDLLDAVHRALVR